MSVTSPSAVQMITRVPSLEFGATLTHRGTRTHTRTQSLLQFQVLQLQYMHGQDRGL